jgi:hypothetical protein
MIKTGLLSGRKHPLFKNLSWMYEGYLESNSDEQLTKQTMRKIYYIQKTHIYLSYCSMYEKNILHTENAYILKLLLNVVMTRIEAHVLSGNKFLYVCVKEVCHLWAQQHFDTFHQLLITVEALWSQPVLQVG